MIKLCQSMIEIISRGCVSDRHVCEHAKSSLRLPERKFPEGLSVWGGRPSPSAAPNRATKASAAVVVPAIVAGQTVETPVRERTMPMGQAGDRWRRHAAVATAGGLADEHLRGGVVVANLFEPQYVARRGCSGLSVGAPWRRARKVSARSVETTIGNRPRPGLPQARARSRFARGDAWCLDSSRGRPSAARLSR